MALWLAAGVAAAQPLRLAINTGVVTHIADERIYSQLLDPRFHAVSGGIWGEAVWNRTFEDVLTQGEWRVVQGVLECKGTGRFRLGPAEMSEYELTAEIQRIGADSLIVGSAVFDAGLEPDRWYPVRVRSDGRRTQVWFQGQARADAGPATLASLGARAGGRFRNIKVTRLDGQVVLEGLPLPARHWFAAGPVEAALDTRSPLNGAWSLKLVAHGSAGIEQHGFAVRAGDTLRGSLWLRGSAAGVTVRLADGAATLASQDLPSPESSWKEFPILLTPSAASANATLQIFFRDAAVNIDQVSLMADSARATGGFRPDLLQAAAALHPPMLRWSAAVDWKNGIGPQAKRVGHARPDDYDPAAFGIDEFIALARKLRSEPWIVVPTGPGDRPRHLQSAKELVEHCKPLGVRFYALADAALAGEFAPAMKQIDSSVQIVTGGYSEWSLEHGGWEGGLEAAEALNALEQKNGIAIAWPSIWLADANAPGGQAALLQFDAARWFPAPGYAVMKLYREHFATDVLQMTGDPHGLDAVATRTPDAGRIYIKLINRRSSDADVELSLRGDFPMANADLQIIVADSPGAGNTLSQPSTIQAHPAPIERDGLSVRFHIPASSVAVVTLAR